MIGWRWWSLEGDVLKSVSHPTKWEGPTLRADKKPTKSNPHGIYCLAKRDKIGAWKPEQFRRAFGKIELSGRVVKGEQGYRAEQATVLALYVKRRDLVRFDADGSRHNTFGAWPDAELLRSLGERYQCDVEVVDDEPEPDAADTFSRMMYSWTPMSWSARSIYPMLTGVGEDENEDDA